MNGLEPQSARILFYAPTLAVAAARLRSGALHPLMRKEIAHFELQRRYFAISVLHPKWDRV